MNKDRLYCSDGDCLTHTCHRHKKSVPRWYSIPIKWDSMKEKCGMYKSYRKMSTIYVPPEEPKEDIDEE